MVPWWRCWALMESLTCAKHSTQRWILVAVVVKSPMCTRRARTGTSSARDGQTRRNALWRHPRHRRIRLCSQDRNSHRALPPHHLCLRFVLDRHHDLLMHHRPLARPRHHSLWLCTRKPQACSTSASTTTFTMRRCSPGTQQGSNVPVEIRGLQKLCPQTRRSSFREPSAAMGATFGSAHLCGRLTLEWPTNTAIVDGFGSAEILWAGLNGSTATPTSQTSVAWQ